MTMTEPRTASRVRECDFAFTLTRDAAGDGQTFSGYAAVFGSPTHIRDADGEYDEVIAPGAFKQTINRGKPVLMFNHGRHPLLGEMPLGRITELREDARGLWVEAKLTDNWLIAPVRDAVREGAISGMSFRFEVVKDHWESRGRGEPRLRTLREVKMQELGPVVFPAYSDTTAAVRSLSALGEAIPGVVINIETRDNAFGASDEMDDPRAQVADAIEQLWGLNDFQSDVDILELTDTSAVFRVVGAATSKHSGLFQVDYTYDNGSMSIGTPTAVLAVFKPLVGIDAQPLHALPRSADDDGTERADDTKPKPPGLTDALKAKYLSELKNAQKNPSTDIAAGMRRLAQWAASGNLPTGLTYADVKWLYDASAAELKRRDPNSTAGGNLPALGSGRSEENKMAERCKSLEEVLAGAAGRSADIGPSEAAASDGSAGEAASVRTGPLTQAQRLQITRRLQLERLGVIRKVS